MKNIFMLFTSIIFLYIGHYYRTYRWKQFVDVYEDIDSNILFKSLSIGYLLNFLLPYRIIGDLVRIIFSGKKMKNGISFSMATVIIERILDILIVGLIFSLFYFSNIDIPKRVSVYIPLSLILLCLLYLSIKNSKFPKKIIKRFSNIFNDNIKFNLLFFSFSFISSLKDIYNILSKKKLIKNTLIMWCSYIFSYFLFSRTITLYGKSMNVTDLFLLLFAKNNTDFLEISFQKKMFRDLLLFGRYYWVFIFYILSPVIILYINSILKNNNIKKNVSNNRLNQLNILPHLKNVDKLHFLEEYFEANKKENLKMYLEMNRDVSVIQDYSAGSNATTILCTDGDNTFFRKYAFFEEGNKLSEQIEWLLYNKNNLKLTNIINYIKKENYCCYDMEYSVNAMSFFNYCHSIKKENSWYLLKKVLSDMENNLYIPNNLGISDVSIIEKYIENKIYKNISMLKNSNLLKEILKYDYIFINGIKYKNFNQFEHYFDMEYLKNIFIFDDHTTIHGDLTIENIVCFPDLKGYDYYIIDPNTGNIHDSSNLDYAKLLQSLHGGYEFLMKTYDINIDKNKITYTFVKSNIYNYLYKNLDAYMNQNFLIEKIRSIYFHEIVHWLRLLPYKFKKNGKRALIFYASFIIILNDIINKYGEDRLK